MTDRIIGPSKRKDMGSMANFVFLFYEDASTVVVFIKSYSAVLSMCPCVTRNMLLAAHILKPFKPFCC